MKKLNITIPDLGYQIDESFKAIRTNLQFCGDDIKVVTITSCTENEGKSTVTLRLAQSLAESGKNTVLVDADMRKSVALRNIDTGGEPIYGLSHYLSGQNLLTIKSSSLTCSDPENPNWAYPNTTSISFGLQLGF